MRPTFYPLGDSALTVTFGSTISDEINSEVQALFGFLKEDGDNIIKDIIPAYASITIVYDVVQIKKLGNGPAFGFIKNKIEHVLTNLSVHKQIERKLIELPVCYDVSFGFDLEEMSTRKKLFTEEIIQLHLSKYYRVYFIGFLPGFAYMGSVDKRIATPRKDIPGIKIPGGSVGIAGDQTGIYPFDSPGGWNIIGRTPVKMFYTKSKDPCLLMPGDTVKFYPISLEEFKQIKMQG